MVVGGSKEILESIFLDSPTPCLPHPSVFELNKESHTNLPRWHVVLTERTEIVDDVAKGRWKAKENILAASELCLGLMD